MDKSGNSSSDSGALPVKRVRGNAGKRHWTMLIVLAVELVVAAWTVSVFLPRDPVLLAKAEQLTAHFPARSPQTSEMPKPPKGPLKGDPDLGFAMPRTGPGSEIRRLAPPSKQGYLVVYVGGCGTCMGINIDAWRHFAAERGLSLVGLASASRAQTIAFARDLGYTTPLIPDPRQQLLRPLNAAWKLRTYLFSPNWHLKWVEESPTYDLFADNGRAISAEVRTEDTSHASQSAPRQS